MDRPFPAQSPSRLIAGLAAKLIACGLVVFLLVGILAPNLVDAHEDAALWGAVLSVAAALAVAAWGVVQTLRDSRRIATARRRLSPRPIEERRS